MPITDDPSAIGDDCEIGADQCPAGYTCQGMSGIVFDSLCEIICEEDCDCPDAHSCQMMQDKVGMWMQCNPD